MRQEDRNKLHYDHRCDPHWAAIADLWNRHFEADMGQADEACLKALMEHLNVLSKLLADGALPRITGLKVFDLACVAGTMNCIGEQMEELGVIARDDAYDIDQHGNVSNRRMF